MQKSFFPLSIQTDYRQDPDHGLFTAVDRQRLAIERADYSKWYCVREIIYEQYLWDMRCWSKPKYQYSKAEVMEQIAKWVRDHEVGNWTNNCGHCLYCIRKLLGTKSATLEDIADYCLKNNFIKYSDQIGAWNNGFEASLEDIKQTGDCLELI